MTEAPAYIYRHTICFEETNVVGNVYYARHVAWQGRCREMFLRDHAADVLAQIDQGLRLVTLSVSCEYFEEFKAFDEIEIRMTLAHQVAHRIGLNFDYLAFRGDNASQAARGFQEVACMRLSGSQLVPTDLPVSLRDALKRFGASYPRVEPTKYSRN